MAFFAYASMCVPFSDGAHFDAAPHFVIIFFPFAKQLFDLIERIDVAVSLLMYQSIFEHKKKLGNQSLDTTARVDKYSMCSLSFHYYSLFMPTLFFSRYKI